MDLINQEELSGFTIRTLDILQYKVAIIVWHTNNVYPDKNLRYVVSIFFRNLIQYLDPTLEKLFSQIVMITFFSTKIIAIFR